MAKFRSSGFQNAKIKDSKSKINSLVARDSPPDLFLFLQRRRLGRRDQLHHAQQRKQQKMGLQHLLNELMQPRGECGIVIREVRCLLKSVRKANQSSAVLQKDRL